MSILTEKQLISRRESERRYRERNPEKRRDQNRRHCAKYYSKNKEKLLAYAKKYREINREIVVASSKRCRLLNLEAYKERHRIYYQKNKDRFQSLRKTPEKRYMNAKYVAKSRGIAWTILESDYKSIISSPRCHYRNHLLGEYGVGLDRIDNSRGYSVDNVVPCCGNCNRIKCHLLTYREMVAVGKLLDEMVLTNATEGDSIGN